MIALGRFLFFAAFAIGGVLWVVNVSAGWVA